MSLGLKAKVMVPVMTLAAAAILAACGGGKEVAPVQQTASAPPSAAAAQEQLPASTPAAPVSGRVGPITELYLSAACQQPGNSSIADFTLGGIATKDGKPNTTMFDAASGIETVFGSYYANPANKSNFVCRNVVLDAGYLVVVASDGKQTNFPPSITHVFKLERQVSGGRGFGYVGSWANFGHQGDNPERVKVVTDDEGLDFLVMGSSVNRGTEQNNQIFSAFERLSGQPYQGNYLAAVTAHRLPQLVPFNPAEFEVRFLPLRALRPVFPLSTPGTDPQVEDVSIPDVEGGGLMAVRVSEDVGGARNYNAAVGMLSLFGAGGFIQSGVNPTTPLKLQKPF